MKYNPNYKLVMREAKGNLFWSKGTSRETSGIELDGV